MQNSNKDSIEEVVRGNHAWNTCDGGVRGLVYSAERVKELAKKKHKKNYWKIGALVGGGIAAIATSLLLLLYFLPTDLSKDVSGETSKQSVVQEPPYEGQILEGMTGKEVSEELIKTLIQICDLKTKSGNIKMDLCIHKQRINNDGSIIKSEFMSRVYYRDLLTEDILEVRSDITSNNPKVEIEVRGGSIESSSDTLKDVIRDNDDFVAALFRDTINNKRDLEYYLDWEPVEYRFISDDRRLEVMFEPNELFENLGLGTSNLVVVPEKIKSLRVSYTQRRKEISKINKNNNMERQEALLTQIGLSSMQSIKDGNEGNKNNIKRQEEFWFDVNEKEDTHKTITTEGNTFFTRFLSSAISTEYRFVPLVLWVKDRKKYVIGSDNPATLEETKVLMFEFVDLIRTWIYLNSIEPEVNEELASYVDVVKHVSDETCKVDSVFESEVVRLVGEMDECKPALYGKGDDYSTAYIKIRKFCGDGKAQYEVECYKKRCISWKDNTESEQNDKGYFFEEDCKDGELTQRVYINTWYLEKAEASISWLFGGEIGITHTIPLLDGKDKDELKSYYERDGYKYYYDETKGDYFFNIKHAMRLEKLIQQFMEHF